MVAGGKSPLPLPRLSPRVSGPADGYSRTRDSQPGAHVGQQQGVNGAERRAWGIGSCRCCYHCHHSRTERSGQLCRCLRCSCCSHIRTTTVPAGCWRWRRHRLVGGGDDTAFWAVATTPPCCRRRSRGGGGGPPLTPRHSHTLASARAADMEGGTMGGENRERHGGGERAGREWRFRSRRDGDAGRQRSRGKTCMVRKMVRD